MEIPRRVVPQPPRRVLVLGSSGSGAAGIASRVAEQFHLAFKELMRNSRERDSASGGDVFLTQAAQPEWVLAADDVLALEAPLKRAEWFVWVDLPLGARITRLVHEALGRCFQAATKPSMRRSQSLWSDMRNIARFNAEMSPRIGAAVERERRNRSIFILRSRRDVRDFLAQLPNVTG